MTMSTIRKPDIQLSNGLYYDFFNPDPDVVTIEVIAHALSQICRYTARLRCNHTAPGLTEYDIDPGRPACARTV